MFPDVVSRRELSVGLRDLKILGVNVPAGTKILEAELDCGTVAYHADRVTSIAGSLFECDFLKPISHVDAVENIALRLKLSDGTTSTSFLKLDK